MEHVIASRYKNFLAHRFLSFDNVCDLATVVRQFLELFCENNENCANLIVFLYFFAICGADVGVVGETREHKYLLRPGD